MEFLNKIWSKIWYGVKKYQTDIILIVGVILISLFSFAMGYIVAKQQKPPLLIEEPNSQIRNEAK